MEVESTMPHLRCGNGDGYGYGNGNGNGDGYGDGDGDGYGYSSLIFGSSPRIGRRCSNE